MHRPNPAARVVSISIAAVALTLAASGCSLPGAGDSAQSNIDGVKKSWESYSGAVGTKNWTAMCAQLTEAGKSNQVADARKAFDSNLPGGCEAAYTQVERETADLASADPVQACSIEAFRTGLARKVPSALSISGCQNLLTTSASAAAATKAYGQKLKAAIDKSATDTQGSTLADIKVTGDTATATKIPPSGARDAKTITITFRKVGGVWLYDVKAGE